MGAPRPERAGLRRRRRDADTSPIADPSRHPDPPPPGHLILPGPGDLHVALGRATAALDESDRRYRTVVDSLQEGVTLQDASGTIVACNASAERILGLTADQMTGLRSIDPRWRAVHEDGSPWPGETHPAMETLRTGTPQRDVIMGVHQPDGSRVWISINSQPVAIPGAPAGGESAGVVVSFTDVTSRKEAEDALRDSRQRLRSLAESVPVGIFRLDEHGQCTYVNARFTEITGYTFDEVSIGLFDWLAAIHPDDRATVEAWWRSPAARAGETSAEYRIVAKDGAVRWIAARNVSQRTADGAFAGAVGSIIDISERVEAQSALAAREAEYRLLAENSSDLIARVSADGTLLYCSPASRSLLGYEPEEMAGAKIDRFASPDAPFDFAGVVSRIERGDGTQVITFRAARRDGRECWCEAAVRGVPGTGGGRAGELIAVCRDITDRKLAEDLLAYQALHEPLTGLPNRSLFLDRLSLALAHSARRKTTTAVLFIDLDRFKIINDSLGHETGDRILVDVGRRLQEVVRPGDTVARFGGDEFTILCEDLDDERQAVAIAERAAAAIGAPMTLEGHEMFLSSSVGIALATDARRRPEDLIRNADAAMYRAKERGKARYEIFDEDMRARDQHRLELERALRKALDRDELVLAYQPIVDIATGTPAGVEALLRWNHPERGSVGPGEFIALAEETGLIIPIGNWVIREAARRAGAWQAAGGAPAGLVVSVNVSARQLAQPDFADTIAAALEEFGASPRLFGIELTESAIMDDPEASVGVLGRLKALGLRLAMDDFGTGYSSLSYLKRIPADTVKVDRSFVAGLVDSAEDSQIVTAVISLAHALRMTAVAEGVETEAQLARLRTLGCDLAQGYLFARPGPAGDLAGIGPQGAAA